MYQISREFEKSQEVEREKRKKERLSDKEHLSKALRTEIEAEVDGEVASDYQELGQRVIAALWGRYRDRFLDRVRFARTFGEDGKFTQALIALERGMPLSSVLMLMI